jgi:arylformamidase
MDAPFHFIARGAGINKVPFDATVGWARVLEIKDKKIVSVEELAAYKIKKGERILLKTANSSLWKSDKFRKSFVYIPGPAAKFIASLGIRCIGVDYLSVGGFHKDGAVTHKTLLSSGIWIIEGLNLSNIRPGNYDLICLPLKILDSDGAPARAIIRPLR